MLTIRFMRFGRRHQPFFRLVAVPKRSKPTRGKYKEKLGWYNPLKKTHAIDRERVQKRIQQGAQVSDSAWNLFVRAGIVEGPKRPVHAHSKGKEQPEGGGSQAEPSAAQVMEPKQDELKKEGAETPVAVDAHGEDAIADPAHESKNGGDV